MGSQMLLDIHHDRGNKIFITYYQLLHNWLDKPFKVFKLYMNSSNPGITMFFPKQLIKVCKYFATTLHIFHRYFAKTVCKYFEMRKKRRKSMHKAEGERGVRQMGTRNKCSQKRVKQKMEKATTHCKHSHSDCCSPECHRILNTWLCHF